MVGSYAPAHIGHIAAMTAAVSALEASGEKVAASIYVPNADAYVSFKVRDTNGIWSFDRRIDLLLGLVPGSVVPTFVDDISGSTPVVDTSITATAISNASARLQIDSKRFVIVVGSDQVASMEPHVAANKAICVVRPGAVAPILNMFRQQWFYQAVASGRYIFTERDNPFEDISSTTLRNAAQHIEHESRE
jgi:nicotinic acid mononucleotide adenylyltransferase